MGSWHGGSHASSTRGGTGVDDGDDGGGFGLGDIEDPAAATRCGARPEAGAAAASASRSNPRTARARRRRSATTVLAARVHHGRVARCRCSARRARQTRRVATKVSTATRRHCCVLGSVSRATRAPRQRAARASTTAIRRRCSACAAPRSAKRARPARTASTTGRTARRTGAPRSRRSAARAPTTTSARAGSVDPWGRASNDRRARELAVGYGRHHWCHCRVRLITWTLCRV